MHRSIERINEDITELWEEAARLEMLEIMGIEKEVKDSRGQSNKWGGFPATSTKRNKQWKKLI